MKSYESLIILQSIKSCPINGMVERDFVCFLSLNKWVIPYRSIPTLARPIVGIQKEVQTQV